MKKKQLLIFVLYFSLILLLHFCLAKKAYAAELGTVGESSTIAEEDFETHIVKQLEALGEDKLKAHQIKIKDKIVANIKRPRAVKGVSKAVSNTARFFDPTLKLDQNIYDTNNQLLYPSGTIINPLDKKDFVEVWIFIDGDDKAQVDFAKNYQANQSLENTENITTITKTNRVKRIILINGAPGIQKDGSFFFYDQAGTISRRLDITKVPSVVRQAPNKALILIEEVFLVKDSNHEGKPSEDLNEKKS